LSTVDLIFAAAAAADIDSIRSSYFDSQRKKAYRYLQAGLLRKSYCAGANVGVGDCHLREIKYHRRYRDDLEEFGVAVSKERR